MRVAQIGNFRHSFCTEVALQKSLQGLGHHVQRHQENTVNWGRLQQLARRRQVDLLLWTRTWDVDHKRALQTLDLYRSLGIPTVSLHLDRWCGLDREYMIDSEPFFRTDHVFTADGGHPQRWLDAGVNHHWLPPGVLADECVPVPPDRDRFPHDVIFVGSHPYPHAEWEPTRTALIDAMAAEFGDRFKVWPGKGQPAIRGRDLATLYASAKVVVGDSCLAGGATAYISDRVPESLGRGALLIHPYVEGIIQSGCGWYEPDHDLIAFSVGDNDRAVGLVQWALDNPEEAAIIRKQGRATVLGRDTYAMRMQTVLDTVAAGVSA